MAIGGGDHWQFISGESDYFTNRHHRSGPAIRRTPFACDRGLLWRVNVIVVALNVRGLTRPPLVGAAGMNPTATLCFYALRH
jgi:hypothetical protein